MLDNLKNNPKLLIQKYDSGIRELKRHIVNNSYFSLNIAVPVCRFRGTYVEKRKKGLTVLGWQRNLARIRKMDVSLPTMITLFIDTDDVITDIELDVSFKGSKGLMCSRRYLNRKLQETLTGTKLNDQFPYRVKLRHMHCFHLTEVLLGIYSYIQVLKRQYPDFQNLPDTLFEEEVTDCYVRHQDILGAGLLVSTGMDTVRYDLNFYDILGKTGFDQKGYISKLDQVVADFFIDHQHRVSETLSLGRSRAKFETLKRMMFACTRHLSRYLYPEQSTIMLHTNLFPMAIISMLIQLIAMNLFNNNYDYIMHSLTALQRSQGKPVCLGGIQSETERKIYFPDFTL